MKHRFGHWKRLSGFYVGRVRRAQMGSLGYLRVDSAPQGDLDAWEEQMQKARNKLFDIILKQPPQVA